MRDFFLTLFPNLFRVFHKKYLIWHLIAIVLTYFLVTTGFDWSYFVFMQKQGLGTLFFPAIFLGSIGPIFLPLILIAYGSIWQKGRVALTGWVIGQAALLGSIVSSAYKALTGRIQPNMHDLVTDISHAFNFGFLKHGIFWGWPSSHTTVTFAMAVALATMFPERKVLKWFSLAVALYIGVGVSFTIHWFSDFLAGAIIGAVIGIIVGKSFKAVVQ